MGTKALQPAFTRGELSPALYARVDLALYQQALKTCRNFIPRPYGGIENRPGTQYVGEVKTSANATRLIPFQFSASQNYVLEFGNLYVRVYRDGARVGTVEVTTPYTTAQIWDIRFVQSADVMTLVHPDHAPRELRRSSDTSWALTTFDYKNGPFKDLNTDAAVTVYADGINGEVALTASDDVFTADHVGSLFYIEENDLSAVPPWEPNKQLVASGSNPYGMKVRNSEGNVYRCVTDETMASNECRTGNVEPTHTEGIAEDGNGKAVTAGATTYAERAGVAWEYLHSGSGIVEITAYNSATSVDATVVTRLPDSLVGSSGGSPYVDTWEFVVLTNGDTEFDITGATATDKDDYEVIYDGTRLSSNDYTIDAATDTITLLFPTTKPKTLTVHELAATGAPAPSSYWAFGAWSEAEGYPSVVTYFADRLAFANTANQPQTVWMSKTGNYTDFGTSVPTVDSDAITFTINARQVNEIRELIPLADLVILTAGGEWRMVSDGIVSPATISLKPQSYRGVRNQRAEVIGNKALYVQKQGSAIRDLSFAFSDGGYVGNDLTLSADHLFRGKTIDEIDFHQVPYALLWAVRSDGVLLSLTYMPEEGVIGWARHDTDGEFESVCVIPEDDEDVPYFIVKRTIDGSTQRYIERMKSRLFDASEDAWFVDSGLMYDGASASTVSGLDHLEGETVAVLNNGNVETQKVVSSGSITLDNAGTKVIVGLPYESDAQTLDVMVMGDSVRDRQKLVTQVSLIVRASRGAWAGTKAVTEGDGADDSMYEFKQRENEDYDDPVDLLTGVATIPVKSTYNQKGSVFIRQVDPLPLSILGIIPEIDVAR